MNLAILFRRSLSLAALASFAIVVAPACKTILEADVGDYEPVAQDMCLCSTSFTLIFETSETCALVIENRLENAEEKVVTAWFDKYVKECRNGCDSAVTCYYTPPVCSVGECKKHEECCSFTENPEACVDNQCVPLSPK